MARSSYECCLAAALQPSPESLGDVGSCSIYGVGARREGSLEAPRAGTASVVRTLECDCMLRLRDSLALRCTYS